MAREQWEEWFSEDVCFHRVVEWCLDIKRNRRLPERIAALYLYLQYLRPFHFRHRAADEVAQKLSRGAKKEPSP